MQYNTVTFICMSMIKLICALLSSVGGSNVMLGLLEYLYASVKALVCTVGGNSVALKDMEKSCSFKGTRLESSMMHGRIKGKQCIYIHYTYKCIIYTTIISYILYMLHMHVMHNAVSIYTVRPVVKTTSTQRPPVLSDHSRTLHYANSMW